MKQVRRTVGIKEVAEHAGVSIGTVSYSLNNPGRVAEATRARVLASMAELGFVRNDLARQLRSGAATTVGMLVLDIANPFFAALAHAAEMAAEKANLTVVLGSSDQDRAREDRYLELFEEQRVGGVLVAAVDGTTERMRALAARVPVVLFDPYAGPDDLCSVALDGAAAGRTGIAHLASVGRRRIALVGGPYHQVRDRWDAAAEAARESGIDVTHVDSAGQTFDEGRRIGAEIAAAGQENRPDALFVANDLMALGVMQSLTAAHVSIPRDIAVMGIDGIQYAAAAPIPLTTIAQPVDELAGTALDLLIEQADDPSGHRHRHHLVAPELIVRGSTLEDAGTGVSSG